MSNVTVRCHWKVCTAFRWQRSAWWPTGLYTSSTDSCRKVHSSSSSSSTTKRIPPMGLSSQSHNTAPWTWCREISIVSRRWILITVFILFHLPPAGHNFHSSKVSQRLLHGLVLIFLFLCLWTPDFSSRSKCHCPQVTLPSASAAKEDIFRSSQQSWCWLRCRLHDYMLFHLIPGESMWLGLCVLFPVELLSCLTCVIINNYIQYAPTAQLRTLWAFAFTTEVSEEFSRAGVFNIFQAKVPQTDGEMEQGPPTIYIA